MSSKTKDIQLAHQDFTSKIPQKELILICEQVSSPANMGSLLRLSEAFSVEKIITSENFTATPRLRKTARNTLDATPVEVSKNILRDIIHLQNKGYIVIALEITEQSKPINQCTYEYDKYALVIGSESHGISPELLNVVDLVLHINMFGTNSSMNVSHATSIALHEIRRNE